MPNADWSITLISRWSLIVSRWRPWAYHTFKGRYDRSNYQNESFTIQYEFFTNFYRNDIIMNCRKYKTARRLKNIHLNDDYKKFNCENESQTFKFTYSAIKRTIIWNSMCLNFRLRCVSIRPTSLQTNLHWYLFTCFCYHF